MNSKEQILSDEAVHHKKLRLWPGIVAVILQWLIWYVIPIIEPSTIATGVFGGLVGGLLVIVWWAFFSRVPVFDRWSAIALMFVILAATSFLLHESIATAMMGMMFAVYAVPILSLVFVIWAILFRNFSIKPRRISMFITIILASGFWVLLRTDGMDATAGQDFNWRWAETHEEKLLSETGDELEAVTPSQIVIDSIAGWPGFRGPKRDGIVHGAVIKTDWNTSPPKEMWRRQIGPGCSSFAINDELFYTQEQRGENEIVSCYNLTTGEPIWRHKDEARFWDAHAGAGPRSTPTLNNGRVYTLGATGILNVLNANDGSVVWSRDAAKDTDKTEPGWGFCGSPLVVDSIVIVAVSGKLAAYDITTGDTLWFGPDGASSYSSPHLMTIDGVEQVLFMSETGATSFSPSTGTILWEHKCGTERIIQPAMTPNGDILISLGGEKGILRLRVKKESGGWGIEELWTSEGLTSSFNDFVIHKGHAYGFKGPRLACIDIKDGKLKWKDARYAGFTVLLANQDLLVILTEKGKLALVETDPDKFTEFAHISAIKGKTWNHPVLMNNILVVRNSKEMVAYKLPLANDS